MAQKLQSLNRHVHPEMFIIIIHHELTSNGRQFEIWRGCSSCQGNASSHGVTNLEEKDDDDDDEDNDEDNDDHNDNDDDDIVDDEDNGGGCKLSKGKKTMMRCDKTSSKSTYQVNRWWGFRGGQQGHIIWKMIFSIHRFLQRYNFRNEFIFMIPTCNVRGAIRRPRF